MNSERGPGINPEDYDIPPSKPAEVMIKKDILPDQSELITKETSLLTKLRGKAQGLAKVLVLFTSLSLASSEEKRGNLEKPEYTLIDVENIKGDRALFLNNAKNFKNIPGLDLAQEIRMVSLAENEAFFNNAKYFKDIPGLDLKKEIQELAGYNPDAFFKNAKDFKDISGLDLAAEIVLLAELHPDIFLKNVKDLKDIPGLNLGELILKAKEEEKRRNESFEFLKNAKDFTNISGLDLVKEIKDIIKHTPEKFLENVNGSIGIPGLDLKKEISQIAIRHAYTFLTNAKNLKDIPGLDLAILILKAKELDPYRFIECIKDFNNVPDLNLTEQITEVSEIYPLSFFSNAKYWKEIMSETELSLITEKIFKDRPEMISRYYESLKSINKPQLDSTKILKQITNLDTAILLNQMVKHGLSESDAKKIMDDDKKLFQTLVEIKSEPDHLGKISVERTLEQTSLEEINKINELHNQPNNIRFASANKLSPAELYTLMAYGEQEIYTSSFNGLFNILLNKLGQDNLDGKKLLEQVGHNKFRTFIKECSSFNKLKEFLDTMDKESAEQLLSSIVSNIDTAEDKLAQATIVADIFSTIQNEDILKVLQKQIKLEYERVANAPNAKKEDKIIYGILSDMFSEKTTINETATEETAEKFKLENLTTVKSSDLFNDDNTNIQQYFFYNDEDGKASFKHFLEQYQNQPDWHITKKDRFVLIKQHKNGRSLEIYANYPEFEAEGPEVIEAILKEKNTKTITIVHRGHSYHAQQTIDRIPSTAKIVSLGSCGGYSNIEQILKKAPKAHILSTKGTGTMLINDPLLKNLNTAIMSGNDIEWPTFWKTIQEKLGDNKNFQDYVPPHQNLGVIFLKTYFQELQK